MNPEAANISEAMQQKAKVCATVAEDKTQESLTGEPHEKAMNEQDAKDWRLKSEIWLEAEATLRASTPDQTPPPNKA